MEVTNIRNHLNIKGYVLVKNIIEPQLLSFLRYSSLFLSYRSIIEKDKDKNGINSNGNSPSKYYAPVIGESLLELLTPVYSQIVNKPLVPTYSFFRRYVEKNELVPHIDRPTCQYSATIQIDSENNKIWEFGIKDKEDNEVNIKANSGDIIFYKGNEVAHWREPLKHKFSCHLFLHWVDSSDPDYKEYWYDGREYLGFPYK